MTWNRVRWCAVTSMVLLSALATSALAQIEFFEGPPKNGLSSRAFRRNALTTNRAALDVLLHHALDDDLFQDAEIRPRLADPRAQAVMEEIIKCALGPEAKLTYLDGSIWRGELGLCKPPTVGSEWGAAGPNERCQQLVTACVMARVNGVGMAVPLSIRGPSSILPAPGDAVGTETTFREAPPGDQGDYLNEGTLIGSFSRRCPGGHDCDWVPAYVGMCNGEGSLAVELAISDPAICGATPVRVCAGIHGCYGPNSGHPLPWQPHGSQDPRRHQYWGLWKERSGACAGSPLTFNCPRDLGGYYSVMTRPAVPAGPRVHGVRPSSPTIVQIAGSGVYPAPETTVFTFREGAFYGNLFDPGELTWTCEVSGDRRVCTPGSGSSGALETCDLRDDARPGSQPCVETLTLPYQKVYACYSLAQQLDSQGSGTDDEGVAYLNSRLCDRADAQCFVHSPRRCHFLNAETNDSRGAHCDWTGDGVYHVCKGPDGQTSYLPLTTYLNDPCDLIGNGDACHHIRRALEPAGRLPAGPRGCGGCSLGDAGGGFLPAPIALLLVLRRRTRRCAR